MFFVNIFEPQSQPQSITINKIFDAGSKGPYNITLIPGVTGAVSVSADNNRRKRIILLDDKPIPIHLDMDGESDLSSTNLNGEKVLLELRYKNEVFAT